MRFVEKFLNGKRYEFLELIIYDEEDEQELMQHVDEEYVYVGMDMLPYLERLAGVRYLVLASGELGSSGYEPLYRHNLLALSIEYENDSFDEPCIDLSRFEHLELLYSRSHYNFVNAEKCCSLRTMVVFNWAENNLLSLSGACIDSLQITGGRLTALDGVQYIPSLRALSLSYCRRLSDVSKLSAVSTLEYLEIDCCGALKIDEVVPMEKLKVLKWIGSNKITSLQNLSSLPNLESALLGINVLDGDIHPLLKLRHASILTDRRHYNLKDGHLPKNEAPFALDGIEHYRAIW